MEDDGPARGWVFDHGAQGGTVGEALGGLVGGQGGVGQVSEGERRGGGELWWS